MKYVLIIGVIVLFSCNKKQIKKEYYQNGKLYKEYQVDNNDVKDGYYKEYYESGNISTTIFFKHGIIKDTIKKYYQNGDIELKKINNILYTYDKNGMISEGKIINDKMIGWWKYYKKNNDTISMKQFIEAPDEKPYFNQNVLYAKGKPIKEYSEFYELEKDTLKKEYLITYHSGTTQKRTILTLFHNKNLKDDFSNLSVVKLDSVKIFHGTNKFKIPYTKNYIFKGFVTERTWEVSENINTQDYLDVNKIFNKTYINENWNHNDYP